MNNTCLFPQSLSFAWESFNFEDNMHTHIYIHTYNVHIYTLYAYMCVNLHTYTYIILSCLVPFCMFYKSSVNSVPVDNSCFWFVSNSFWFLCYKLHFQLFPRILWIISAWCNVFIEIFFNDNFQEQKYFLQYF